MSKCMTIILHGIALLSIDVLSPIQYTRFTMLFHEKTKKAVGKGFIVVSILVILSMILAYFPGWR